jgi:predicted P-loop ATPase
MNKAGIHARYHDLNTVLRSEFVQPYHPMEVYLSTLPPWDGTTDHIARLAATIHVKGDVAFWERNFKKWLVAWFAGILDEQVVNHVILVLISETQGTYKTTWFQRLLAPALRNYFQPRPFTGKFGKDDRLAMAEFFLICIDELDTMPPSALNQLKAMVTELTVVERAPYAEFKEVRPHIASFCGTGNHLQFLSDPTGNRRMFPVEVTDIDDPYTTVVDYAGVYAQAYALYKSGFVYWFTAEEVAALNAYNRDFEAPSEEEELIRVFFRNPKPGETGLLLSASEIAAKIGVYTKKQLSLRKIATVLKGQGYVQMRKDGSRVYRVEEKSVEEIAAYRRTAANSDATEAELPF